MKHKEQPEPQSLTTQELKANNKAFYDSLKRLELTPEQKKRIDESDELSGLFNRIASSFKEEEE